MTTRPVNSRFAARTRNIDYNFMQCTAKSNHNCANKPIKSNHLITIRSKKSETGIQTQIHLFCIIKQFQNDSLWKFRLIFQAFNLKSQGKIFQHANLILGEGKSFGNLSYHLVWRRTYIFYISTRDEEYFETRSSQMPGRKKRKNNIG